MVATANRLIIDVLGAVPDPGQGKAPPGSDGVTQILSWTAWIVFAICVGGVLVAAATMAVSSRRGEGGEHMSRLGFVLGACIIAGSASALVGALA